MMKQAAETAALQSFAAHRLRLAALSSAQEQTAPVYCAEM
jgi:hypothetical protein